MTADSAVLTASILATLASYMDPVVDAPVFWICIGALLTILTATAIGMAIVWAAERYRLPGERE